MGFVDMLPSGDYANHGWTLNGSGVTKVYQALNNDDDTKFISSPANKCDATVRFPQNLTSIPTGAEITSVTVFIRCASVGTPLKTATMNLIPSDKTSNFRGRNIYPSTTPTTFEVATYVRDARGIPWDHHRLNKILCRIFSYHKIANGIRCYKMFVRVNYRVRPIVDIEKPTGIVYTPSPTIEWTYQQEDGDPQYQAEYRIFTASQVQAKKFNPNWAKPVFSETIQGQVNSVILPTSLNPDQYYVYVRGFSSPKCASEWVSREFEVQGPAPGVPGDDNAGVTGTPGVGVATVVPDSVESATYLTMRDSSNMLSVQQADFETTTDFLGYTTTNCSIERNPDLHFGSGLASMKMTASSAATMSATSTLVEVEQSTPVTVRAQFRAGTTGRTVNLRVLWFDNEFGSLGSTITATGSDSSTTWTEVVGTGTSPAGTAYAKVQLEIVSPANAEVHNVDHVGLMYGTGSAWTDGGHMSRNLLTSFQATGDDPSEANGWVAADGATSLARVAPAGTGGSGLLCNRMTYTGISPSIAFRGVGSTFTSPSSGADFTLNKPASAATGDLMIAFVTSNVPATITPPTGWTLVNTKSAENNHALWVLKRTVVGGDPASWSGELSATATRRSAVVVAYSGAASADSQFIAEGIRSDSDGSVSHTTATVTNTDSNAWRIAAFAARDNSSGSFTANKDAANVPPPIQYVGRATKWSTGYSSSSYTINRPSGVKSGDLMIASVAVRDVVSTVTPPSGWTLVRKASQNDPYNPVTMAILKRTAGSSEPSSWTGSLSESERPILTNAVAYRNAKSASLQFIDDGTSTNDLGTNITTDTVTNTKSTSWRISVFACQTGTQGAAWDWSTETVERLNETRYVDTGSDIHDQKNLAMAFYDSNGTISTGNHSRTATSTHTWYGAISWIGIIEALDTIPAPGADETERADFTVGSSNPWGRLAVYDSGAVIPTGLTSVTGTYSPSTADSILSWIGIIKPQAPTLSGNVGTRLNESISLETVDPWIFDLADNKLTMVASFLGSIAGTSYLEMEFYRGNALIDTVIEVGTSFGTSVWTKSVATFDIPEGTTHILPRISAATLEVSDTVSFDRVSVAFGESPTWRNGTGRDEHPIWSIPELQYADDDSTGYTDWTTLPGLRVNPPEFDQLTGKSLYTDHTVVPLNLRKYRIQSLSFGLAGDKYASGFGPSSEEVTFTAQNWWLKDIKNPADNMILKVKADPTSVGTTNTAVSFQPLGEDYPIVLTEGYKSDTVELTLILTRNEHSALKKLFRSGRTLYLQSDVDHAWWVRPVGDLDSETQVTSQRKVNPIRFVDVTFVQVAPEL